MLIIDMISRKHKELYLDYNTFKRENELYEIFILISVKVTQCYFQEKQYQMVEEGLKSREPIILIWNRNSSVIEKWSF